MDDEPSTRITKSSSAPEADEINSITHEGLKPPPSDIMNGNADLAAGLHEDAVDTADYLTAHPTTSDGLVTPSTPGLSRTGSSDDELFHFDSEAYGQDGAFPPVDRLTIFDLLENFALPQRLENLQQTFHDNAEKLRKQRAKLANRAESWRKRVPLSQPDEQLDKYRRRMRVSVDRLNKRWSNLRTVTMGEKISFVTATLNIFISGYLIGAWPHLFHYWYTAQLAYFMPVRWYKYHSTGYHYFLADLCYFVNLLLTLSIWFFPQSKRLFISTFCLAFGNNAVAIAMWRNSLVFHSLDKVTSLFIHIMPCATLHVLVHLIPESLQQERFPAVYNIKFSNPNAKEHYGLKEMVIWSTLPYTAWQLAYHLLITVRKRSKIAEGRPTSFTWLRKSYSQNPLGKFVLSFPEAWQETVFMFIQYSYAVLTMLPCPIWFWYRWASAGFLGIVFTWATWNGATFYIDVFRGKLEKELEQLKKEVSRMSQDGAVTPAVGSPVGPKGKEMRDGQSTALDLGPAANTRSRSDGQSSKANGNVESGEVREKSR